MAYNKDLGRKLTDVFSDTVRAERPNRDRGWNQLNPDEGYRDSELQRKHKIFLSHSGAQKNFVEDLCVRLENINRFPFFDQRTDSLPLGERFPDAIFRAAKQCQVAVAVLSEEFFTSKWPMLELVAFMEERKSGVNKGLKILPLFFKISLIEFKDSTRRNKWFSIWEGWARADGRIKLDKWKHALEELPIFNGIQYVEQGEGDLSYRNKVVEALCKLVQPDVRWGNAGDVQGRLRICRRILAKFEKTCPSLRYKGRVVGLYGAGGIGKTTFCKELLDELETKFLGKVCHVEIGSRTQEEFLQLLIGSLTETDSRRGFENWDHGQCQNYLQKEVRRKETFLAIDNVSPETAGQAIVYLEFGFHENSVVLVTARTRSILTSHLQIDERDCMEMPDLEKEEATRLFLKRAGLVDDSVWMKDHDNIVQECVDECLYSKGNDANHHYHPLSLLVLGGQLRSVDPSKWQEILAEEPDIKFNLSGEMPHPVFSIFERSYNSLRKAEQLLFMDVTLFTPERYLRLGIPGSIFTWLSMVHNLSETQVCTRLELLNTRGMLEDLGDGSRSIRMHDLFREFAKWKAKAMNLDTQECLYVTEDITELRKARAGNCCQELARIALKPSYDLKSFAGIQWKYFSNVVVLKLFECDLCDEDLDLKWLKLLKSLDVNGCEGLTQLPGLQELEDLTYLRLVSVEIDIETLNQLPVSLKYLHLQDLLDLRNPPNLDHCTNLLGLTLEGCDASLSDYPDLSKLSLIQKIYFSGSSYKALTVRGLSLRLSNLQSLRVVANRWRPLRCPEGFRELIGLQELQLLHVDSTELPDFHRFTNLKKMEILGDNLTRLSGLRSLAKIEQIILRGCSNLRSLERLEQLPGLQLLHLGGCRNLASLEVYNCVNLTMCLGLSDLTALEELHLSNVGVSDVPDLKELYLRNVGLPLHLGPQGQSNFSSLKILNLQGCTELKSLEEMGSLPALLRLDISYCSKLIDLPDLSKSLKLELLDFSHSAVERLLRYEDVYTLASLPLLKPVTIVNKEYSAEANQKRKQKMISWQPKYFGMDQKTFYDMNTYFMFKRMRGDFDEAEGYSLLQRVASEQKPISA